MSHRQREGEKEKAPIVSSKRDLANRYQSMVADQFQSVSNFEDKAWKAVRVNIALLGIYLTGLSILVQTSVSTPNIATIDTPPILIGIISLFVSLIYAIIVLLGIKIGFGPSTDTAESLIKSDLEPEEYDSIIVTNYAETVRANWGVLEDKSRRLRKSYSFLVIGLIQISLGLIFLISPDYPRIVETKIGAFIAASAVAGYIAYYIWDKGYESLDDEGGERSEPLDDQDGENEKTSLRGLLRSRRID